MQNDDFGFTLVQPTNINKLKKDASVGKEMSEHYLQKMNELKALIMPLLTNLAKDPGKDIHWPNRDVKIKEIIAKIEQITIDNREIFTK